MIIRPEDWRTQGWANGQGTTHEIWRTPAGPAPFDVRLSIAELTGPAPFSPLPGVDRFLLALDPVELTIDGTRHVLARHEHVQFAGEADTWGRPLHGPGRDCNVMVRRGLDVRIRVTTGPEAIRRRHALVALDLATLVTTLATDDALELGPGILLIDF
jgi:environmental stress-induced protein Ves